MAVDKSLHILVVDDQDTVLELLREILRTLGLRNVETAKDGGAALEKLRGAVEPFGLVMSDWNMRPVSGLQLLQAVRGDPRLATTPFIMITGEASKDRVVAAIDAGTTSFIVKPFSVEAVKKRLVSVLGEF